VCLPGGDLGACGINGASCQGCFGFCFLGTCLVSLPGGGGGDGGTGTPCTQTDQCAAGPLFDNARCISERRADGGISGWPSGYCSSTCLSGTCPGNGECLSDNYCYAACTTPGQGRGACRPGYVCAQLFYAADGGVIPGRGACYPDCRNVGVTCLNGSTCNALGHCE
jgi:hypothetical protein